MNPQHVCFEFGRDALLVLAGDTGLEVPLQRGADGRLTPAGRAAVLAALAPVFPPRGWQAARPAWCAVGARGVSLRRLTLPPTAAADRERVLRLQIEAEFPLSPDELAWGAVPLPGAGPPAGAAPGAQVWLAAAVRRELLADYAELLTTAGFAPVFTLAAAARAGLGNVVEAQLDLGPDGAEFATFENGAPTLLRALPWGNENLPAALQRALGVSRDEAERVLTRLEADAAAPGEYGRLVNQAIDTAVTELAALVRPVFTGRRLHLSGPANVPGLAGRLARALGAGIVCEGLPRAVGPGRSAAALGLQRAAVPPPPVLQLSATPAARALAPGAAARPYALAAGLLALGCVLLPFGEAWVRQPALARRLAALKTEREHLPTIDRELAFLEYLQTNQPAYSDALLVLANAAPPGAKIENLSMTQRGEVALRGAMQNATQVTEFRKKLIDSGFFASVVVEEQAPTPDRQRVNVRLGAQWKPLAARANLKIPVTTAPNGGGGGGPGMPAGFPGMMSEGGGMPMGMPTPPGSGGEGGPPPAAARRSAAARAARGTGPGAPTAPPALPEGITLPPGVELPPGFVMPPSFVMPAQGTPMLVAPIPAQEGGPQ